MRITREYLESFIGKKVKVTFWDNDIRVGVLKNNKAGVWWECPKWYHIDNLSFRLSHLKKIEEVN